MRHVERAIAPRKTPRVPSEQTVVYSSLPMPGAVGRFQHQEIFDRLEDGVFLTDEKGIVVESNKSVGQILGFEKEEILGKPLWDIQAQLCVEDSPALRRKFKSRISRLLKTGQVDPAGRLLDPQIRSRDGTWLTIQEKVLTIPVRAGFLIVDMIRDVTEFKQVEEELRTSRESYRIVADHTHSWEKWLAPNGTYLYVSPSCEPITGYRPEEFLQDSNLLVKITHPDDRPLIAQHLRDALANREEQCDFDFRIVNRSGQIRWLAHRCQSVYSQNGEWLGRRSSNTDITERKQVEVALRLSEQKYRDIIHSSKDGILLIDQTGIIVEWNPCLEQITGLNPHVAIGKPIQDVWSKIDSETQRNPGVLTQFEEIVHYLTTTGDVSRLKPFETRIIQHVDGTLRTVQLTIFPIQAENGYMVGSICRDITDANRAEEALAAEKERLDITLHSIGDGVITTDLLQRIILFNPVAEQLTGWTSAQAVGRSLAEVFHLINKVTRQAVVNPAQITLEIGEILGMPADTALIAKDGTERIISSSIAPIRGRTNEITGVALVFRDVTQLRLAEEALQESREYARSLIESSLDMIIAVDNNRRIIEFNRAAQQAFGYSREEILGKDISLLYADPSAGAEISRIIVKTGGVIQEVMNRRKNGQVFPTRLSASLLRNTHGEPVGGMGVSRDITQLKLAEEQNIRAERLGALGHMAAALAHEINNPLQAIQSTLDLVLDFPLDAAEREENLKIIRQEIERLSQVTGRVLQFARPAAAPRRLISITNLLKQTLALASKHLQHSHITVDTDLQDLPLMLASAEQLAQTFLNLILNAIEATGEGGHLDIALRAEEQDVVISFANDGPSIPPDVLSRIFEPFFTTKQEGSGLGLSVSHSIVQQHGGTLTAENLGAERGVRFVIRLPLEPQGHEQSYD